MKISAISSIAAVCVAGCLVSSAFAAEPAEKNEAQPSITATTILRKELFKGQKAEGVLATWIPGTHQIAAICNGSLVIADADTDTSEIILDGPFKNDQLVVSPDAAGVLLQEGNYTLLCDLKTREKTDFLDLGYKKTNFSGGGTFKTWAIPLWLEWSPDGKNVAYYMMDKGIFVVRTDGSKNNNIIPGDENESPHWSPKGDRICFTKRSKKPDIWIANSDGSDVNKFIDNAGSMAWFPQGNKVCFVRDRLLFIKDLATNAETRIAAFDSPTPDNSHGNARYFSISPDGMNIAYNYNVFGPDKDSGILTQTGSEIYVYNVKTKKAINITNKPGQMFMMPSWSSDGKNVLCNRVKETYDKNPVWIVIDVQ